MRPPVVNRLVTVTAPEWYGAPAILRDLVDGFYEVEVAHGLRLALLPGEFTQAPPGATVPDTRPVRPAALPRRQLRPGYADPNAGPVGRERKHYGVER